MMINMILIINHTKDYQRKKREILASENQKEYTIDDDSCWKIGFLGPYYYNKADPKTFVYCGTQMVFNTAKTSYKYFVISIWVFIIGLLIIVFGYPFYLEYTNQLVDVAIENNVIVVDSPLYDAKINLDNINELTINTPVANINMESSELRPLARYTGSGTPSSSYYYDGTNYYTVWVDTGAHRNHPVKFCYANQLIGG